MEEVKPIATEKYDIQYRQIQQVNRRKKISIPGSVRILMQKTTGLKFKRIFLSKFISAETNRHEDLS